MMSVLFTFQNWKLFADRLCIKVNNCITNSLNLVNAQCILSTFLFSKKKSLVVFVITKCLKTNRCIINLSIKLYIIGVSLQKF